MQKHHAYIRPVPEREADPFEADAESAFGVLLVEDQDEAADSLSVLLRMDGFKVFRAPDGPTALAAARAGVIDAIVLDLQLPGMDGFEVCRRLRTDPATASLVIVMLTGADGTQAKIDGLGFGADDYLVKPIASRELGARLRNLLEVRQRQARELPHERRQAFGEIATALCHEVNHPLTAALGSVDLLLLTRELTPDVRRELEECQKHLIRIGRILSRLDNVPVPARPVVYLRSDRPSWFHR